MIFCLRCPISRYFSPLAPDSVTTSKIKDAAVKTAKIAANTITAAKIAANAVGSSEIAPNAVGYSELAPQSVEPRCIKTLSGLPPTPSQVPVYDETGPNYWWFKWANVASRPLTPPVAAAEIAPDAVTTEKIALGAVIGDRLSVDSVSTEKIQNGAVTTPKIASSAVTSSQLSVDSVITEKIANGAVTQEKLAPGVGGGERHEFLNPSVEGFYLASQSFPIDWTVADLSPWIPANARAAIVQVGIFTQAISSGARAEMRVRTNDAQREALCVSNGQQDKTNWNGGLVPITSGRALEYRLDVAGTITVTLWISIIGYLV
ncbi:MAG: hypothetical protein AB1599_06325 [Planctomycetota bacterium]